MQWLVAWSVRRRGVVATLALAFLVLGASRARLTPIDVFPEFVPAQVSIQTEAPGLTPDQVEALVTRPIEAAVNGAPGLASLRSESIPGLSVVDISFAPGTNPQRAHQDVAERLAGAGALPEGAGAPKLSPLTSSTMDVLKIGLVSDTLNAFALRDLAEWSLKPQLLAVNGVARVNVFGGSIRQLQVAPDLAKLAAYDVTLADLAEAARGALALRGAGFIDTAAQRVLIESPVPEPDTAALAAAVVTVRNGVPLRLGDFAAVTLSAAVRAGDATIMGRDGVLLTLSSQFGANTLDVTRALEAALADITPRLAAEGVRVYPALHRPATFIERALLNLRTGLIVAALFVLIVLFAFLRNVRAALISFVTIPLSLLAATLVLGAFGLTLNAMTLGGFAVAVGVLVDDAIIDIENILRRLRANALLSAPLPRLEVVRDASLEIRAPVLFATLAVVALFVPVYFISGVQGKFIGPLALAFVAAVLASLLVALTVTPALSALALGAGSAHAEARWITRLKERQAAAAVWLSERFVAVAVVLVVAVGAALLWLPRLGGQFMPDFEEGHFVVQASSALPGTGFDDMLGIGRRLSAQILALPYVATVEQQIGRAELGEDTWGPNRSELHVELKPDPGIDQRAAQAAIRAIVASYPGIRTEVVTFLGDRFSESLTGETAAVVVNVFGDDLDVLDQTGARVAAALRGTPGVADLQYERQSATPTVIVRPRAEALAAHGVQRRELLDVVQTAFAGLRVGQTFVGNRTVDAVLILPPGARDRIETIGALNVKSPFGPVAVSQLADVQAGVGRSQIRHLDGQRRVAITFNVAGRDLQSTVAEARARIAALEPLPTGTFVRFAGQAEAERAARIELVLFAAAAVLAVVLLLTVCFRRRAYPWLVLVNLPFSLLGSIAAIGFTGVGLSIGTLVGLVTVFGISARNSILLLAHYEHLLDVEGATWNRATALRGASERLVPILMTALVTALGLAPLAFGLGSAGYEIEAPMAITVLGGLATSTILNLLVLLGFVERATPLPPGSTLQRAF